ncbi:NPF8.3, partial [Symbiodinium microadriaticum]
MAAASESESADSSESPDEAKKVRKIPVMVILLVELCERLTYYTLAGTQKIYLQNQLHKLPSTAAALNSVFSMLCYFWCIPGGLIADSVGRYKTIIGAGAIYATGTLCVAIAVVHAFQTSLGWMFTGGCLVLIAAGTGGIKPNIANFGADQIGDETESQRECQKTYFSLFYLAINIGVLFAFGFFTNITTGGLPGVVSQSEGYSFAYGAGAVFMIAAVLIFISFTPSYRRLPGNGLGPVKRLVRYQCRSLRGGGWRAVMSAIGWLCLPLFYIVTLAAVLTPKATTASEQVFLDPCSSASGTRRLHGGTISINDTLNDTALALGSLACVCLVVANVRCSWVQKLGDESKNSFNQVEAARTFAAIPVIIVVNLSFSLCYNSMNNAFPSQACQMDVRLGGGQLNGAFFNIADALAIVVFTPIFESCVYPLIARLKGSPVSLGQKMVTGLLVAAVSNFSAAVLEVKRRAAPPLCDVGFSQCAPGYSEDGLAGTRMRDISGFWIFLPYILVGIAEILVNPCDPAAQEPARGDVFAEFAALVASAPVKLDKADRQSLQTAGNGRPSTSPRLQPRHHRLQVAGLLRSQRATCLRTSRHPCRHRWPQMRLQQRQVARDRSDPRSRRAKTNGRLSTCRRSPMRPCRVRLLVLQRLLPTARQKKENGLPSISRHSHRRHLEVQARRRSPACLRSGMPSMSWMRVGIRQAPLRPRTSGMLFRVPWRSHMATQAPAKLDKADRQSLQTAG